MFALQFGRVFWKEYRTQKSLWLSCIFIGFLFELICAFFLHEGQGESILIGSPSIFAAMYAVGCAALMFANEREQRTSDWLLGLSILPGATLGAKFAFAAGATIALQLALVLISFIISASLRFSDFYISEFPAALQPIGLLVLVWAALGSLMSRRTVASVAAMVFGAAVTVWIPFVAMILVSYCLFGESERLVTRLGYVLMACSTVAVLYADVWLGRRWCQGKYLDGSLIEDFGARCARWWNERTGGVLQTTRPRVQVESEESWRRSWQRLIWQERYRESLHTLLLVLGCAIGAMVAFIDGFGFPGTTAFACLICLAIPGVMGVLAFESDTDHKQLRFLVSRGISPGSVWLSKQAVWLPRAFWIPAIIFIVSLLFESLFVPGRPSEADFRLQRLVRDLSQWDIAIWYVLISYSCGQFVSLLLQRAVLAGVFGIILNIVAAVWQVSMVGMQIPLWWSIGIPVVAMLLFTLWQMKPRMLEDYSWPRWRKMILAFVAVPVFVAGGVTSYARSLEARDLRLNPQPDALYRQNERLRMKQEHLRKTTGFVSEPK